MRKIYDQKMLTPTEFDTISARLRNLLDDLGYVETFPQSRLSILAACEDPSTVRSFTFDGFNYPLPQTNQMWLEHDLLVNPDLAGVYCFTASYRDEQFPIEGRHDKLFPMFEFEGRGEYEDLNFLLEHIVYNLFEAEPIQIMRFDYETLCQKYGSSILKAEHEEKMREDLGDFVMINRFPQRTSPFWNMKQSEQKTEQGEQLYNKTDLIICGIETIGAAERSVDPVTMRDNFHSISEGGYSQLLYHEFSKERVEAELEDYLALKMTPRFGAGIGLTRLLRAMKIKGIL